MKIETKEYSSRANTYNESLILIESFDSLSANPTKWSNTLKQFVDCLPTNYLSVLDHFLGLALKGLNASCQCTHNLN